MRAPSPSLSLLSLSLVLAACGGDPADGATSQPEPDGVEVHGPGPGGALALIPDGSATPSAQNGTDFGTWSAGTIGNPVPPRAQLFEVRNVGLEDVALPGTPHVEVRGAGAARFVVTDLCVDVLPGGTAMSFVLGFDGLGSFGPHAAEVAVHLAGRDYTFAVRGETVPTGQH